MFCDVALPVPLEGTFTYRVDGVAPVVGGRVLVQFRDKRLPGVVVALRDKSPSAVEPKLVLSVLDTAPVLDAELMRLGEWIAQYYIAPLGEVFRTMLPLSAEWRRVRGCQITELGLEVLRRRASSSSTTLFPDQQDNGSPSVTHRIAPNRGREGEAPGESAVLEYLAQRSGQAVREAALRAATGASRAMLTALLRKKWVASADLSSTRDAKRTVQVAVLKSFNAEVAEEAGELIKAKHAEDAEVAKDAEAGRKKRRPLNANQKRIVEAIKAAGGRLAVDELRSLSVPKTTLATLVKRGIFEIEEAPASFAVSSMVRRSPLDFVFNPAQQAALEKINAAVAQGKFSVSLIHGVTGSGKTAVYLAAMRAVLEQGRSAIMLVPEIGLTPAAAAQLHQIFGEQVAILHSGLNDDERAEQWHRIRRGEARMVVGTRSAVFAPVSELALIVVDEEQDQSYKQDETPRYNARDVAVMRAKMTGAAVVLGSATPSLESYHNARRGRYALIELPDRVEQRPLPEVELVDMRREFQETGHEQVISRRLAEEIGERLARGEQAMILLNRRGFSAFMLCRACGETLQCRDCAVAMTYHKHPSRLPLAPSGARSGSGAPRMECHYCGYVQKVPKVCPKCGSEYVQFLGAGSEKLEERLHAAFPQARIGRLDRDTVRGRHDFERVLNALDAGELDVLVGTQMIAKGHDVHGVTLVGVVGADAALAFPDFRSAERTFQLLTQVGGRAGRGATAGKVILQTYFSEHYAVQFAAHHDFNGFYDKELRFRSWMHYPPFTAIANVLVRSDRLEEALKYTGILGEWLRKTRHEGIRVLGPAVAPIARLRNDYRYHVLLKSSSREKLNAMLREMLNYAASQKISRTNVIVDVDAVSLL
ncbi:MAG: primosomal protein N' [Terriglobales bacterium]